MFMDHMRDLLGRFPQLNSDVLQAVLEAHQFDADATFGVLCDMVVGAGMLQKDDCTTVISKKSIEENDDGANIEEFKDVAIADVGAKNEEQHENGIHKRKSDKRKRTRDHSSMMLVDRNSLGDLGNPWRGRERNGRGLSFAGKVKAKELSSRYSWANEKVIEVILEECGEAVEDAEGVLLEMYPVDTAEAFKGGHTYSDQEIITPSSTRRKVAEILRQADERELWRVATGIDEIKLRRDIAWLKRDISRHSALRNNFYQMASHTRRAEHGSQGKHHHDLVEKYSTRLVKLVMLTPDFKGDCIDLHGFSVNQALKLVSAKLDQVLPSRVYPRLKIVTGRGKHSVNMKAILRPAVEKVLRERHLKFSADSDGGTLTVFIR